MPTRSNAGYKTPLELLTGKVPNLTNIVPWGTRVSAHQTAHNGQSSKSRARDLRRLWTSNQRLSRLRTTHPQDY
ncbi:TPA: hypothetical protein N0F65_002904 [Lagenidium giganteum]|uniref:Uncharacterized protein n=1 Tax=Lagenidium giganteum TaxID=4803 RepID=A0AAV2Z960_9STRA|nr:TPA: hypothetical protein N0F65_002904 [Lagenidium giganteum]